MQIYIVERCEGQYEDRYSWPVKAFRTKEAAEKFANSQQKVYDKLEKEFESIDIDIQELKDKVFDEYLKETNLKFFTEYKETVKAIDKLHANGDYDTEPDFNWTEYYNIQSDFEENAELFDKYSKKCGLSKKEIHWIEIDKEYSKLNDGIPYFHVSYNPIELVDE